MNQESSKPLYRMLIADDDEQLCDLLSRRLGRDGFFIESVHDGQSALDRVMTDHFDVLLLDHRMPNLSGMEVLKKLNQTDPTFPIVVLSGYGSDEFAVQALRAGASDYVTKSGGIDFCQIVRDKALHAIWRFENERQRREQIASLQQQVAELGCLYALEKLFENVESSPRSALLAAADVINPASTTKKDSCVVIHIGKEQYPSTGVFDSIRQERFRIAARGRRIGFLEVRFRQADDQVAQNRNSLTELERDLMLAVADRIGSFIDFWNTEQRLRESNAELEEYASVASHDLQAPLQKIESFAELIIEDYGNQLDKTGAHYLDVIRSSAVRMRRLIRDILALSRLEAGDIEFQTVDLNEVLADVKDLLSRMLIDRGAILNVGSLPTVRGDSTRLVQLFQNLIGNAVKFNREQPPIIDVGMENDPFGNPWIFIRDNGIGMKQQDVDRVFLPFKRLHSNQEFEGTGIGLALCRKIVRQHEGTINIDSELGKGSTFWIQFPKDSKSEDEARDTAMLQPIGTE